MTYILQFVKSGSEYPKDKDAADTIEKVEVPEGVSAVKFAAHRVVHHGGHSATIYYPSGHARTIYLNEVRGVSLASISRYIDHEKITCKKYCQKGA